MLHQMQHTNHSIFVSESAKVFSLQLYKDIFTKASILVTRINGFCFNLLGDNLPILEINEKKKEKKKERIALLSKDKKGVNQKFFSFFLLIVYFITKSSEFCFAYLTRRCKIVAALHFNLHIFVIKKTNINNQAESCSNMGFTSALCHLTPNYFVILKEEAGQARANLSSAFFSISASIILFIRAPSSSYVV